MTTPTHPAEPSTEAGRYRRLMEREAGLREKARRGESWESTTDEDVALLLWEIDRLRADSTPAQELLTDRDRRIAELEASRDAAARVEEATLREAADRLDWSARLSSFDRDQGAFHHAAEIVRSLAAEPVPAAGLDVERLGAARATGPREARLREAGQAMYDAIRPFWESVQVPHPPPAEHGTVVEAAVPVEHTAESALIAAMKGWDRALRSTASPALDMAAAELDAAWVALEAVLPRHRELTVHIGYWPNGEADTRYEADVELEDDPKAAGDPYPGPMLDEVCYGPTPAATLNALAARLAAAPQPARETEAAGDAE